MNTKKIESQITAVIVFGQRFQHYRHQQDNELLLVMKLPNERTIEWETEAYL